MYHDIITSRPCQAIETHIAKRIIQKWENLAKEAKVRYEKEMKEYKEKLKESGGAPSPAKKSKSIKDMMKKKETPKKEGDNTKFKSKEYIETDDDSSSSDDDDATEKVSCSVCFPFLFVVYVLVCPVLVFGPLGLF